jgi:hypothetical protein
MLGAASIPMSAFPLAGDITGLAADAAMYSAYPEERTMGNYAMSALGVLPLVPGAAALRAARGESKTATNAINVQGIDIPIRKPSDNINNVMQANFNYPNIIGNQTLNINDIYGGVRADPNERRRVDDLSAKISGEGGFISRIIVDQDNNVVEGQHRLEALRQLGASEVPVYKIEDLSSTLPVLEMENAINNSGKIHPDNVNQIMQYALENIAEHGIDGARDFDFGNYQKYYDAALRAARGTTSPLEGAMDMSTDARMQTEYELAHEVAQRNAALPVEQGGLGLPPDNTAMDRANAPGMFPDDAYHFSRHGADVQELDSGKYAIAPFDAVGTHVGSKEQAFDRFENTVGYKVNNPIYANDELIGVTYPLRVNTGNRMLSPSGLVMSETPISMGFSASADYGNLKTSNEALRESIFPKYDSIPYINEVESPGQISYILPPKNIRSRFAAFDPAKRDSANLLAGAAGATFGLSALRNIQREDEQSRIE